MFALERSERERVWLLEREGAMVGSVAIVDAGRRMAQLRWLLVVPGARGGGLGRWLLREAIEFARGEHYRGLFLWTVASLEAAARLYCAAGFELTSEAMREIWGTTLTQQRYDLALSTPALLREL